MVIYCLVGAEQRERERERGITPIQPKQCHYGPLKCKNKGTQKSWKPGREVLLRQITGRGHWRDKPGSSRGSASPLAPAAPPPRRATGGQEPRGHTRRPPAGRTSRPRCAPAGAAPAATACLAPGPAASPARGPGAGPPPPPDILGKATGRRRACRSAAAPPACRRTAAAPRTALGGAALQRLRERDVGDGLHQ